MSDTHVYRMQHTPGAEGIEIEFRPLTLLDIMADFPELLAPALPEAHVGKKDSMVDKVRQRAMQQAGIAEKTEDALTLSVATMVKVINHACTELRLYSRWDLVPRDSEDQPRPGCFHHEQLGADGPALYLAILEASGLALERLVRVREFLKHRDQVVCLHLLAQRYGTRPSRLLGLSDLEPAALAADLYAANRGMEFVAQSLKTAGKA